MARRATIVLALLLALALSAAPPARGAQDSAAAPPAPVAPTAGKPPVTLEGGEVFITAEHLERNSEQRTIVGEGAVTIRFREMRMAADRVVYNEVTREVVADGNVVLDSGADRIQGEHLELNIETRVGFFERAQGFLQTYYFTGERLEKRGPDHYFLRGGSFTTCEGVLPDWSFRATSTELTVDEYLTAWNPTLRIMKLPVLWFPYAVFPIKRDRSTGLLIPTVRVTSADGFTLGNAFYWAPRDNFDATIGVDYLAKTGWGASGEMRYLLAPRTQGIVTAYYQRNTATDGVRWTLATRNSQELPLGLHAEIDAFFQSDREFIGTQGKTIEERSSERTTSSFFINRNWASWNFDLSGRYEVSLLTEDRTTLTRFPELRIDRTSTRLFGTGIFFKVAANGAFLERDLTTSTISTTRLHLAPEVTWPLSIGSVARVVPTAGYALTDYSENLAGEKETRALPYFKIGLEGPRPYRIWDLSPGGRFTKLKHLIEPSVAYVFTPDVDQQNLPQFDAIDYIPPANRVEYSIINTLYAKKIGAPAPAPAPAPVAAAEPAAQSLLAGFGAPTAKAVEPGAQGQLSTTQELLWVKLSQSYTFDSAVESAVAVQSFSAIELEARTRPLTGLEVSYRGNFDVYGKGFGYHNVSLSWKAPGYLTFQGDWRSTRDSSQDFLDLGGTVALGRLDVQLRSRYNLDEGAFVENRIGLKYVSQCWDVAVGYVKWTEDFEYMLTFSLKGIGTIVRI